MRRLAPALAVILVLATTFPVWAERMGSPGRTTDTGAWGVGVEWAHWERDMYFDKLHDRLRVKSNLLMARWEYGATQELELNFKLGAAEANIPHLGFNGRSTFAAGAGVKAILYESGDLTISGLGQGSYFETNDAIAGFHADVGMMQYDLGIGGAYQVDRLCPYGGAMLSYVDGNVDSVVSGHDFESDNPWGMFLGVNYEWRENVTIGVEGETYGDGWGISLMVGYNL